MSCSSLPLSLLENSNAERCAANGWSPLWAWLSRASGCRFPSVFLEPQADVLQVPSLGPTVNGVPSGNTRP